MFRTDAAADTKTPRTACRRRGLRYMVRWL